MRRLRSGRSRGFYDGLYLLGNSPVVLCEIKRYEAGTSQPSLEAIKKIAKTLRVTTDSLIFEEEELEPDADLVADHVIALGPR